MFDHVTIRVSNREASRRFYETGLATLGIAPAEAGADYDEEFHRVALAAGYRDNGAPAKRPRYHPGYYGAYVLDPDGHNVEAVHHDRPPPEGPVGV